MTKPWINSAMPEAIIFDLDGTLFQTETLLLPAYHAAFDQLRAEGIYEGATPPDEYILSSLGLLLEEIWRRVIPNEPDKVHRRADELLLECQLKALHQGVGTLYPGVSETLNRLRAKGIRLFVASNGLEKYVKEVISRMGIAPVFDDIYSAGQYQTASKNDLVCLLIKAHQIKQGWMVGDRISDIQAAKHNKLYAVGCDYAGFHEPHELKDADQRISSFPELLSLVVQP